MYGAERGQITDDRFELRQRLGSGGMGTVWRAWDTTLYREVALKEMRPTEDQAAPATPGAARVLRERVLREARALARLSHPNVVRIYHIIDADPHPWLVMELLPGPSLQDRLEREGVLPWQQVARYGLDVLAALRAAHAAGIHHRDVKPANIVLRDDGGAVLTDFGIAKDTGSEAGSLTATNTIIGSPEYMAPERVRGAADHPAADLWSLGMTLYVLAEGHNPMRRETALATLIAVAEEPVPPPARSGPLGEVLRAVLVQEPQARPDAAGFEEMLARVSGASYAARRPTAPLPVPVTTAASATPPPPRGSAGVRPPGRRGRGGRRAAWLAVGALLLAGGLAAALPLLNDGSGGGPEATPTTDTSTGTESPPPPSEPVRSGPSPEQGPRVGTWIAQLFSEPVASGTAARDQRLAELRVRVPEAEVLLSDDYASLVPGYWVAYVRGPFDDGLDALAFCAARGRTTADECIGTYLSDNPDDNDLACFPPDGGKGRCTP